MHNLSDVYFLILLQGVISIVLVLYIQQYFYEFVRLLQITCQYLI